MASVHMSQRQLDAILAARGGPLPTPTRGGTGRRRDPRKRPDHEGRALLLLTAHGLTPEATQLRFHEPAPGERRRQFRFDFAWPSAKVALEIEGGIWMASHDPDEPGRHTTGAGYRSDCVKYNLAQLAGWLVLRVDDRLIDDGSMLTWVRAALTQRGWKGAS